MFSNLRKLKSSVENELISRTDNPLQHSRYPALFLDLLSYVLSILL